MDEKQIRNLEEFAAWLREEALPAGLIGPQEEKRLWGRHIADSLVFAVGWKTVPGTVTDVGTGAGLPGVPLAVLWPECRVVLVERSQRRADLVSRLIRILSLGNLEVRVAEADQLEASAGMVMRAVLRPQQAVELCGRLLLPAGRAVLGWPKGVTLGDARAWCGKRDLRLTRREVPASILDESPSVLIIAARG